MKTLLYFGPSGIGDWCFIWPSIPALLAQEQCDQLDIVIPYENAGNQLLNDHPLVNRICYLERETSGVGLIRYGLRWLRLLWQIRRQRHPALAVSYLSNQADNLLLCILSGVPRRIGRDFPFSRLLSRAFTHPIHTDSGHGRVNVHRAYLAGSRAEHSAAANLFDRLPVHEIPDAIKSRLKQAYVVVAAGGGRGAEWRFWPAASYRELVRDNPTIQFVLLGHGADDERQAALIQSPSPLENLLDLTSQTSMHSALAIVRGASAVVGNDTGIPNLSATQGIPTLVVYGPTDPAITGAALLGAQEAHIDVPCGPCFDDTQNAAAARRCVHRNCLNQLAPDPVNRALRVLLAGATHTP